MSLNLSVEVIGSDKLDKLFSTAPDIVTRELSRAVDSTALKLEREAVTIAPHAFGQLQGSIRAKTAKRIGNDIQGSVAVGKNYGAYVEFGTAPHFPPISALKDWARKVLGDEKLAYPVAKAISKRGTKPRKYMQTSMQTIKPDFTNFMQTAIGNILNALSK